MQLAELVRPALTTILSMEMERGVVGDLARFPGPAEAVRDAGIVPRCAALYAAARSHGMRVVHCTAAFRPDRAGSFRNMPAVNQVIDDPEHLPLGTPATSVLPELVDPADVESSRLHGIAPWIGTELDSIVRSFGTRTVVITGVSLNRGIIGMTMGAVDNGYDAVVVTDAVAGYPPEYGALVLEHTLSGIATLATADQVMTAWDGAT